MFMRPMFASSCVALLQCACVCAVRAVAMRCAVLRTCAVRGVAMPRLCSVQCAASTADQRTESALERTGEWPQRTVNSQSTTVLRVRHTQSSRPKKLYSSVLLTLARPREIRLKSLQASLCERGETHTKHATVAANTQVHPFSPAGTVAKARKPSFRERALAGASAAAFSSRKDLVQNFGVRPTHWLIYAQAPSTRPRSA